MQITTLLTWVSATLKIEIGGYVHIFPQRSKKVCIHFQQHYHNILKSFIKDTMSSNVFSIIIFFFQGKRIGKKKKTSVKSCNLNPYWNESFVFLIDEMDMKRVWLDVTVSIFLKP